MMSQKMAEIVAVFATLVGIGATISLPFVYQSRLLARDSDIQVINLTGVNSAGTWTEEEVNGWNYWRGNFTASRPVLNVGRTTRFRLKSADVLHTFYAPALGVGPVQVYPGHVVELEVRPAEQGIFQYYCTTVCGMPHFGMRGEVVVQGKAGAVTTASLPSSEKYWLEPHPPANASLVERGGWLFRQKGCLTCHGPEGSGGVPNWNYVKGTVPALNTLAERLMLFDPEDVKVVVEQMESGKNLDSLVASPPVPRFNVFLAQYDSVRNVIRKGSPPGRKDPHGPLPPLEMLAWGERLSEADIDAVIAYLLTLQP
ncbi:MAG: c-type cytochrome [Acidobacteria bacterium]|nr:c-type cytochrome [Acidobacteriota bacterium]